MKKYQWWLRHGGVVLVAVCLYVGFAWILPITHMGWWGPIAGHGAAGAFLWAAYGTGSLDGD